MTDRMFHTDNELSLSLETSRSGHPAVPVCGEASGNAIMGSMVPAPTPGLLSQNLPKELLV